jgi:hypothetical protein
MRHSCVSKTDVLWTVIFGEKTAKNMSTEYVSLFPTVPKMPVHSVDAGLRAMFWFRASLALFAFIN